MYKTSFIKTLLLVLVVGAQAFGFAEGKDYLKLKNPIPNAENTFIKVFNYSCPFCFKYDKTVTPKVLEVLDKNIEFKFYALKTKGAYGQEAADLVAVMSVLDEEQGISGREVYTNKKSLVKKVKDALYIGYHKKRIQWKSKDEFIDTGLKAASVSRAQYDKYLKDERAQKLLKAWEISYSVGAVQGIPGFVVNGKYLIYTKSIRSIEGMAKLIEELNKK